MSDRDVSIDTLRRFALVFSVLWLAITGVLLPLFGVLDNARWPWAVPLPLVLLAIFVPRWLRPFYVGWLRFGAVLNWINSRIILSFIFFLILTPMALVRRLLGADPLQLRDDADAESYRQESEPVEAEDMKAPF